MVKLLGCILIIAATSSVGFIIAENIKKRLIQLKEFQNALLALQNEIYFTRTSLPQACEKVSTVSKEPVKALFLKLSVNLKSNSFDSVYEAFVSTVREERANFNIIDQDMDIFINLSKTLGESDIDGHKKIFSLTDQKINMIIQELDRRVVKDIKMYRSLGVSLGAVIVILLI